MQGIDTKLGICLLISFFTIVPIVTIIVTGKKWIAKHKEKNTYIVRMPAWFTRLMIASAIFSYATALAAVFQEELELVVLAVPFCFIFMTDFGCFLASFWVIEVNEEEGRLVYFRPPFLPKKINFSDITKVEYLENRMQKTLPLSWWNWKRLLRVYQYSEKLFEIDDTMYEFERLRKCFETLEFNEKRELAKNGRSTGYTLQIEPGLLKPGIVEKAELKNDFSLTESGSEKWGDGIAAALFLFGIIASVFNWEEWTGEDPNYVYYFVGMILMVLLFSVGFIRQILIKISVYDHKIFVRNGIGQVKSYTMQEISRIVEKEHCIVLYSKGKEVAIVSKDYKDYASFVAWMGRELGED